MKIIAASDHVGYPLKKAAVEYLRSSGYEVFDAGPDSPDQPVDYTDYAARVKRAVASGAYERGILVCGTGLGMSIAANKMSGVRAGLVHDVYTARQARAHNDANVLCMGAYVVSAPKAEGILDTWMNTPFDGGRHVPRLAVLDQYLEEEPAAVLDGFRFGTSLSPLQSKFGPLLFAGDLEAGLAGASRAGLDGVELSLRDPDALDAQDLQAGLEKHALSLLAVATGQSCIGDALCLSSGDPAVLQATADRLCSIIALAGSLGAPVIIGGIRGRFGPEQDHNEQWAKAVEAVQHCARIAREHNTHLLIEPINRYETNFINSARDGMRFIEDVAEGNVRLLLDTFHMNLEERSIEGALRDAAEFLGYVHFADSNRQAPGQGHINFERLLGTLVDIGYRGPITMEVLPLPDDVQAMQHIAGFLQQIGRRN